MEHIFIQGDKNKPLLLLLHGTGGNESSLLSLAKEIDPRASVLGVRGNVIENGMNRFFRRISEGVFDEEDLIYRTNELYEFIEYASIKYSYDFKNIIAIGYSNGANIAASLLYLKGKVLRGAILHHPMVPLRNVELKDLNEVEVFIGAGKNDPITPMNEAIELESSLKSANATVWINWENNGHQLTVNEVKAAKEWYMKRIDNLLI